jgi:serine-type D-Ala-D-Ala carboxypeptidase (penicillin-binding protein 5/6)
MRPRRLAVAACAALAACALVVMSLGGTALAAPKSDQGKSHKKKPKHETPGPPVEALSWGLMDGRTGEIILSHAGKKKLPIASTTKLMTAYVAMKENPLDRKVKAVPYDAEYGESLMNYRNGQEISIRDLIYGLILRSGNDAAHTLAVRTSGSTEKFVAQMNRYAAALGLTDTHYANPVGLDQKGNYSSADDLMTLTRHLLEDPAFAKIADSREATLKSMDPPRKIHTINELLEDAPWITGVKTGHTWGAAYVLVGSGKKGGTELISVAIGAPSDEARFADNLELLEYGFGLYKKRSPVKKGQSFADASIRYSGGELPLRATERLKIGVREGQKVETHVEAPREVTGPVKQGAKLGRVLVTVDGSRAGSVPLAAGRGIPKASFVDRARHFLDEHRIPIAVAIFAILLCGMLLWIWVRRRNRNRRKGIPGVVAE